MSYIEKVKQNKVTAEKAAAFDRLQQEMRDQDLYNMGGNDAYASVERELMRRVSQQRPRYLGEGLASSLSTSSY